VARTEFDMRRMSHSLMLWSLLLVIRYRPSPFELTCVMPLRWPTSTPDSLADRLSHTLHSISSDPVKNTCDVSSANATELMSSSCAGT